eukprot:58803-Chlamydomonas_euryale.AAC.2
MRWQGWRVVGRAMAGTPSKHHGVRRSNSSRRLLGGLHRSMTTSATTGAAPLCPGTTRPHDPAPVGAAAPPLTAVARCGAARAEATPVAAAAAATAAAGAAGDSLPLVPGCCGVACTGDPPGAASLPRECLPAGEPAENVVRGVKKLRPSSPATSPPSDAGGQGGKECSDGTRAPAPLPPPHPTCAPPSTSQPSSSLQPPQWFARLRRRLPGDTSGCVGDTSGFTEGDSEHPALASTGAARCSLDAVIAALRPELLPSCGSVGLWVASCGAAAQPEPPTPSNSCTSVRGFRTGEAGPASAWPPPPSPP